MSVSNKKKSKTLALVFTMLCLMLLSCNRDHITQTFFYKNGRIKSVLKIDTNYLQQGPNVFFF